LTPKYEIAPAKADVPLRCIPSTKTLLTDTVKYYFRRIRQPKQGNIWRDFAKIERWWLFLGNFGAAAPLITAM
jgi:hypothetical protein